LQATPRQVGGCCKTSKKVFSLPKYSFSYFKKICQTDIIAIAISFFSEPLL